MATVTAVSDAGYTVATNVPANTPATMLADTLTKIAAETAGGTAGGLVTATGLQALASTITADSSGSAVLMASANQRACSCKHGRRGRPGHRRQWRSGSQQFVQQPEDGLGFADEQQRQRLSGPESQRYDRRLQQPCHYQRDVVCEKYKSAKPRLQMANLLETCRSRPVPWWALPCKPVLSIPSAALIACRSRNGLVRGSVALHSQSR